MKKLFVQFYLLLFVCFLVMTMLVGLVYKFTAERAGRQSLDDLMKSSLYLMRSELRDPATRLGENPERAGSQSVIRFTHRAVERFRSGPARHAASARRGHRRAG